MIRNVFILVFLSVFILLQSCKDDPKDNPDPEDSETSLRIENATGQNFLHLIPPEVVPEPNYGKVQNFSYTINVGHFGFNADTLADGESTAYRTSYTETSATQLFTRCRFDYTVYQTSSTYYPKSIDVKDTIDLPELIECKLGKKYTLILNDLNGDVDFVESE